jgi:hypothetical protein
MRARGDWRRQQEQTLRAALAEIQRLLDALDDTTRATHLPALARQAEHLFLAATALDRESRAAGPYARR